MVDVVQDCTNCLGPAGNIVNQTQTLKICANNYSQSATYVYSSLPDLYLKMFTRFLTKWASTYAYLSRVTIYHIFFRSALFQLFSLCEVRLNRRFFRSIMKRLFTQKNIYMTFLQIRDIYTGQLKKSVIFGIQPVFVIFLFKPSWLSL